MIFRRPYSPEPTVWSRFRTISQTVVRLPLVRETNARWFRRTKGGGRSSQVLCGPARPILAEIHRPSAFGATVKLSRWCRARRGISNKYSKRWATLCGFAFLTTSMPAGITGKHMVKETSHRQLKRPRSFIWKCSMIGEISFPGRRSFLASLSSIFPWHSSKRPST